MGFRTYQLLLALLFLQLKSSLSYTTAYTGKLQTMLNLTYVRSFENHTVFRVESRSLMDVDALAKLHQQHKFDFWTRPRPKGFTDIMVEPEQKTELVQFLQDHNLAHTEHIPDVEELTERERKSHLKRVPAGMDWNAYYPLDQIYDWMDEIEENNTGLATIIIYGNSTEGRPLKAMHVSRGGTDKPTIFIDATIHAREWISTAVATYVVDQVTTNGSSYPFLERVNFYIVPVVNPDGYVYSHRHNRGWRKNRANKGAASGCHGVDLNRNFNVSWGEGKGASDNICKDTYKGPFPFSEPESVGLRDLILNSTAPIEAYITLHSYSQFWTTPWGFTKELPDDYEEMKQLGDRAAMAVKEQFGTTFQVGSVTALMPPAGGGSDYWAKAVPKIKYVYTVELRDNGTFGFLLPPSLINETVTETWAGIQVVANHVAGTSPSSSYSYLTDSHYKYY